MSNGQDISLQGAYRQDQDAKLEVKPTDFDYEFLSMIGIGLALGTGAWFFVGRPHY